jgi:hypothetical protein
MLHDGHCMQATATEQGDPAHSAESAAAQVSEGCRMLAEDARLDVYCCILPALGGRGNELPSGVLFTAYNIELFGASHEDQSRPICSDLDQGPSIGEVCSQPRDITDDSEQRLKDLQEEVEKLREQLASSLSSRSDSKDQDLADMQSRAEASEQKVTDLSDMLKESVKARQKLEQELESVFEQLELPQQQASLLIHQTEQQAEELEQVTQAAAAGKEQIAKLEARVSQLLSDLKELQDEHEGVSEGVGS